MRLLMLLCLGVLTVQGSFFSVTHSNYRGKYSDGTVLERLFMGFSGSASLNLARTMCTRRCVHNADCHSSTVLSPLGTNQLQCILGNQNMCDNPRNELLPHEGLALNFDKVPDTGKPMTCQEICIYSGGNCLLCQRPGCWGNDCGSCSQDCNSCHQTFYPLSSLQLEETCTLWSFRYSSYQFPSTCFNNMLLIYRRFVFRNGTIMEKSAENNFPWGGRSLLLNDRKTTLYIQLFIENMIAPYTANYSGFSCDQYSQLSVGAYIGGTAGDGLGAPLYSVPYDNSTFGELCGPFWNLTSSTLSSPANTSYDLSSCPGRGTAWFGTPQFNVTKNESFSGIAWASLPDVHFIGINVYMY